MPDRVTLTVDLEAVAANARSVAAALPGIEIVGVTKCTCGSPEVARSLLAGGAVAIGESRHENGARLRAAGIDAPLGCCAAPSRNAPPRRSTCSTSRLRASSRRSRHSTPRPHGAEALT